MRNLLFGLVFLLQLHLQACKDNDLQETPCTEDEYACYSTASVTNNVTYISGSTYEMELQILLQNLTSINTSKPGFTVSTSPNMKAYGLVACRADMTPDQCSNCTVSAQQYAKESTPFKVGVAVSRDLCYLRYDDHNFFWDYKHGGCDSMKSLAKSSNPNWFNSTVNQLISDLAAKATVPKVDGYGNGYAGFAHSSVKDGVEKTDIYGFVQCWGFINATSCHSCLMDTVGMFQGSMEGTALRLNCYVRYGNTKFYYSDAARNSVTVLFADMDITSATRFLCLILNR